ncbi:heparinase II/III domain-containing protein [Kribbella sp. CA-294648]|uniref:heparinase II/III domain-containing protein n=1 Tax=Kribbella sp. CA-294648 TaxID=3239948 RepID=UPI003D8DD2D9
MTTDLRSLLKGARDRIPVRPLRDREAWAAVDREVLAGLLTKAEAERARPWPTPTLSQYARFWRDGERTPYEDGVRELLHRTALNVIVAAATGAQEWLDEAADGLLMLCEQTSWCWAAHESFATARGEVLPDPRDPYVDLGAGESAAVLAWADLVLDSALDERVPGLRRRMRAEVRERVIDPFLRRRDWHWLGLDGRQHNWNPWIHSNVLITALTLVDDPDLQAEVVDLVLDGLGRYVAALPADGGCDEGYAYWWNGPARLAAALELVDWATAGALNSFDAPVLRELARFPHRMALGDGWYVNVADGPARPSADQPWHVLHRWGARIADPAVMAHAAAHKRPLINHEAGLGRALVGLFDQAWTAAEPADPPLPATTWLADVQVLVARQQAGSATGLTLAAKGGHNAENHNHNDVGSYLVAYDGTPVLIDLGQPTYARSTFNEDRYTIWTMQSQWHNTPTINGQGQLNGQRYTAREVAAHLTDDTAELRLDIAAAYPPESNCDNWQRTARVDRKTGAVVVTDAWPTTTKAVLRHVLAGTVIARADGSADLRTLTGGIVKLVWDPALGQGDLETHAITDPLLTNVWGDAVHRLSIAVGQGGTFELTIEPGVQHD